MMDTLDNVYCDVMVEKPLPSCEHRALMHCSMDPKQYSCTASCDMMMACCSHNCTAPCSTCQQLNAPSLEGKTSRQSHRQHSCERELFCGHRCQAACSIDHVCTTSCNRACRQTCSHAVCRKSCATPCAPCQERCTWYLIPVDMTFEIHSYADCRTCPHFTCPVPCGSVCCNLNSNVN